MPAGRISTAPVTLTQYSARSRCALLSDCCPPRKPPLGLAGGVAQIDEDHAHRGRGAAPAHGPRGERPAPSPACCCCPARSPSAIRSSAAVGLPRPRPAGGRPRGGRQGRGRARAGCVELPAAGRREQDGERGGGGTATDASTSSWVATIVPPTAGRRVGPLNRRPAGRGGANRGRRHLVEQLGAVAEARSRWPRGAGALPPGAPPKTAFTLTVPTGSKAAARCACAMSGGEHGGGEPVVVSRGEERKALLEVRRPRRTGATGPNVCLDQHGRACGGRRASTVGGGERTPGALGQRPPPVSRVGAGGLRASVHLRRGRRRASAGRRAAGPSARSTRPPPRRARRGTVGDRGVAVDALDGDADGPASAKAPSAAWLRGPGRVDARVDDERVVAAVLADRLGVGAGADERERPAGGGAPTCATTATSAAATASRRCRRRRGARARRRAGGRRGLVDQRPVSGQRSLGLWTTVLPVTSAAPSRPAATATGSSTGSGRAPRHGAGDHVDRVPGAVEGARDAGDRARRTGAACPPRAWTPPAASAGGLPVSRVLRAASSSAGRRSADAAAWSAAARSAGGVRAQPRRRHGPGGARSPSCGWRRSGRARRSRLCAGPAR